jgi:hypothetical protein
MEKIEHWRMVNLRERKKLSENRERIERGERVNYSNVTREPDQD